LRQLHTYCLKAALLLRQNGFFATTRKALYVLHRDFHEWRFDFQRDVNTRDRDMSHGHGYSALPPSAMPYDATTPILFREIMKAAGQLRMPSTFFDMGCGKGRVLIMAAEHGYTRVVGVEFNPVLVAIAKMNIERFYRKKRQRACIEVLHGDAGVYEFPDCDAVIFFYNPFDESVMAKTLQNIRNSMKNHKVRYLIYHMAQFRSLLGDSGKYELLVKTDDYTIYRVIA
jgi:SAM-dependent methyltransferase